MQSGLDFETSETTNARTAVPIMARFSKGAASELTERSSVPSISNNLARVVQVRTSVGTWRFQ